LKQSLHGNACRGISCKRSHSFGLSTGLSGFKTWPAITPLVSPPK
jgi:hypothetical protein